MLHKDFRKITGWALFAVLVVYATGWFIAFRETSAAYYAAMCAEIVRSASSFPFSLSDNPDTANFSIPIWLSAISMQIFGSNHVAYRLPGILPAILSLYAVYRFTKLYYSTETAFLAATIFATMEASFLMNLDVAPNTYQSGFYMFTIWQIAAYFRGWKFQNLVTAVIGLMLLILSGDSYPASPGSAAGILAITLLASAPWTLFLIPGLIIRIKSILPYAQRKFPEQISLFGFLVPLTLFLFDSSLSITQPFMLLPLGAVIAAHFIASTFYPEGSKKGHALYRIQTLLAYLLLAALFFLVWFPFPDNNYYGMIHYFALLSVFSWIVFFSQIRNKLVISTIVLAIGANLVLNSYFYPNMSSYQASFKLGTIARGDGVRPGQFFSYQAGSSDLLQFYAGARAVETSDFQALVRKRNCWVYTHQGLLGQFRALRPDLKIIARNPDFEDYSEIFSFLDPEKRSQVVSQKILIKL